MKKKWISVKCGLSRDPKHRVAMGEAIWLFLHILDLADWDTGTVPSWKDEAESEELGMPIRTMREHRRKLDELGYISCVQKQYSQEITIHNWTNPREYSGEVSNKKTPKQPQGYIQGDNILPPLEVPQGYIQGSTKDVTPTFNPKNQTIINDDDESLTRRTKIFATLFGENIGMITPLTADIIQDAVVDYPLESWYKPAFEIAVKSNARNLNYVLAVLKGWKEHEFGWSPQFKKNGAKHGNSPTTSTGANTGNSTGTRTGGYEWADRGSGK